MFETVNYSITRQGVHVILKNNKNIALACIFVDSTDNRLTIKSIDANTPLDAIKTLINYLDENFGAKQIFIVPPNLQLIFMQFGFTNNPASNPASARLRETSFEKLKKTQPKSYADMQFICGENLKKADPKEIDVLMQNSGFLKSKIEQYNMQSYEGFQLMCDYSIPFGIKDKSGKLVAFCRITDLGNSDYYLGDTFVDEKVFGSKLEGTAYLYQRVGAQLKTGRILLIAPPDRVDEFEKNYGCTAPNNIMVKFGQGGPELAKVFEEEKNRILSQQKTNTTSYKP